MEAFADLRPSNVDMAEPCTSKSLPVVVSPDKDVVQQDVELQTRSLRDRETDRHRSKEESVSNARGSIGLSDNDLETTECHRLSEHIASETSPEPGLGSTSPENGSLEPSAVSDGDHPALVAKQSTAQKRVQDMTFSSSATERTQPSSFSKFVWSNPLVHRDRADHQQT